MRVFDREQNEQRTLRKAQQIAQEQLQSKENIAGLTLGDSPEFADVKITSLAADGTLGNIAKSVKSYLTQLWSKLTAHTDLTTTAHGGIVGSTDGRLTNSRTPTAHKSSHATGDSDALTPADIGAATSGHNHSGTYEPVFSAGTTAQFWRGDKVWVALNQAAVAGLTTADSPTFTSLRLVGLPVYANNAAAVTGGLTAGAFYRTGADPDPVPQPTAFISSRVPR